MSESEPESNLPSDSPSKERRGCRITLRTISGILCLLVFLIALASPVILDFVHLQQHRAFAQQVKDDITSLKQRRPDDVPAAQWNEAVDWTSNLISQAYFSPVDSDPDSLRQLAESMRQKITGDIDLATLQWVWDECEKAPRNGAQNAIRFRDVRLLTKEPITDDDLPKLWSLDRCLYLELQNTQVTDDGLEHLHGLSNLKYISLAGTQVTDEGVAKLQAALPDCEISR